MSRATCTKSSGKVQGTGFGPGIAASFPCRDFLGVYLLLQKVRSNRDVICETDHLGQRIHRPREIDEPPDFDPSRVVGFPRYFKLEAEYRSYFSLPLTSIVAWPAPEILTSAF